MIKKMIRHINIFLVFYFVNVPSFAQDLSNETSQFPNVTTEHVRAYQYSPKETYIINMAPFTTTTIIFPEGENVFDINTSAVAVGSDLVSVNSAARMSNKLVLMAQKRNGSTSLTVTSSNDRTYSFIIRVDDSSNADLVVYMKLTAVDLAYNSRVKLLNDRQKIREIVDGTKIDEDYLKSIASLDIKQLTNPNSLISQRINANYEVIKNDFDYSISVFDDGYFTFFQLGGNDKEAFNKIDVPAIYSISRSSKGAFDKITNYRVIDGSNYMAVEQVNYDGFTIRAGNKTACIRFKK